MNRERVCVVLVVICCENRSLEQAAQFARTIDYVSAEHTTAASGIGSMLSRAELDDYVFEPCGYSMNGCEGEGFSTIHVTPETGFSYASVELSNYAAKAVDPTQLVTKVEKSRLSHSANASCALLVLQT